MILKQTMIAYTVAEKTPLTTHLETVNLQLLSKLRASTGLTKKKYQLNPSIEEKLFGLSTTLLRQQNTN